MANNKIVVTNGTAFQLALNNAALPGSPITCISIESDLLIPTNINGFSLPANVGNISKRLVIEGNGASLGPGGSSQVLGIINRVFPTQPANIALTKSDSFVFNNINFLGGNVRCPGLELELCSNTQVNNCTFSNNLRGVVLRTVSNCSVNDCKVDSYTTTGYEVSYKTEQWAGGKNVAYSSNVVFSNCIANAFGAQGLAGFFNKASKNIVLNNCTVGGGSPRHHILYDSEGGITSGIQVLNNFEVNNLTINSAVTSNVTYDTSAIRLKLADGFAKLNGLYSVFGGVLINASNSGTSAPHLYVSNVPYLDPSAQFQTDGSYMDNCSIVDPSNTVVWSLEEIYSPNTIFESTRWVNSILPYYRYAESFSWSAESKFIQTNFMRVNSNTISS